MTDDKPRRRLTSSPVGFLAGFAQRRCLDACFDALYRQRAALLGYDLLPPEQVERARLAAARMRDGR